MTDPEPRAAQDPHAPRRRRGAARRKASRYLGQLDRYETALTALIDDLRATRPADDRALDRVLRRHKKDGGSFSKSDIIQAWRHLSRERGWRDDGFVERLRLKPMRTGSGVAPVTVLTRPHPCPGRCVFCPSDTRMPKSYLSMEPGAQRATQNRFDPFLQTWNRLRAFHNNGHPVDKVELIVLGGTFSSYPEPYQVWFVQRCFDALNRFDGGPAPAAAEAAAGHDFLDVPLDVSPQDDASYNRVVARYLERSPAAVRARAVEHATWASLEATQRDNERAACRSVGLSLETRPDLIDEDEVRRLRRLGATKVQVGVQSLDDAILARNHRGHDAAAARRAIGLLRRAAFKVQLHWMPNLLGATPDGDLLDFRRLFDDPWLRPDELKIYPTCLIDGTALTAAHARGEWQPYDEASLLDLIEACIRSTPRYCRINRVIRDIPSHDVVAGNRKGNLREVAERRLRERGVRGNDIRARQVRRRIDDASSLVLRRDEYDAAVGDEVFLEAVTGRDELAGFLRLHLPRRTSFVAELGGAALIREVHVYGTAASLGDDAGEVQHRGVGRRLIAAAEELARRRGYRDIAVISAIGTRLYYRDLGYRDQGLYLKRDLTAEGAP